MGKPLSTDLRSRLTAAVAGGLSRRAAAGRFGVSPASAVRWVQAENTTGSVEAKPQGGDMRSRRIEAFRDVILGAVRAQKERAYNSVDGLMDKVPIYCIILYYILLYYIILYYIILY